MKMFLQDNFEIIEDDVFVTSIYKDNKGYVNYKVNKINKDLEITSDYLTSEEIVEFKKSFNGIKVETSVLNNNELVSAALKSVKGSYAWSIWKNVTITPTNKVSAQAVATAITAYIPKVGPIASALAIIFIDNNLSTGHFSFRVGTAMDSDPNYYWEQRQVKLFKDSARRNLLSNKTTIATKFTMPTS